MKCAELTALLAKGQPLTQEALGHLQSCPGCGPMMQVLNASNADPTPQQLDEISRTLAGSLRPVKPIPGDRVLVLLLIGLATLLSIAGSSIVGQEGLEALSGIERLVYFTAIISAFAVISLAAIREWIPGSPRRFPLFPAVAIAVSAVAAAVLILFHNFGTDQFAARGVHCLRIGCVCALCAGIVAAFLCRRGFATRPVAASLAAGCLTGMVGVAVLALYCPYLNSLHVVVWHLGTVGVAAAVSAALAAVRFRRAEAR